MTPKKLAQSFSLLPPQQQALYLARWAHLLTVDARGTYVPGTEAIADPVRLRGYNEILHRITSHISAILKQDSNRYPDDVFFAMLLEAAQELHATSFRQALEIALPPSSTTPPDPSPISLKKKAQAKA